MEKIYKFTVPIRGFVEMEVIAENEAEAKKKIICGEVVYESLAEIDTWYTERACLAEELRVLESELLRPNK